MSVLNPLTINLNNLYLEFIGFIILLSTLGIFLFLIIHYIIVGPNAKNLGKFKPEIPRLNSLERLSHFIRLVSTIILAVTGIAFALFNVKNIGLSYSFAYKIHLVFALFFTITTLVSTPIWFRDSFFKSYDWEWLKVLGGYLTRRELYPPSDKFNAGQKLFYWFSTLLSFFIIISGYLLASPERFSLNILVWTAVIHGISAITLVAIVIPHAYLGSVANPGTIGTIIHGKVSKEWAKIHHPLWFDELEKP